VKYLEKASVANVEFLLIGLQIGAKAEKDLYLSGLRAAITIEPFPPMLWPIIDFTPFYTGK